MRFIIARTTSLETNEIKEFKTNHIPYRIQILKNLITYPNKHNDDPYWPSIYESGQIICRMFIEFFGLGVNGSNTPQLVAKHNYFSKDGSNTYDVKIRDLRIEFITLNELSTEEANILAHAYECGNRATAHFTYGSPFKPNPAKVIKAAEIILKILDSKHLKAANNGNRCTSHQKTGKRR